ncbi:hypothetical protein BH09ACT3_BH09ACT3_00190 [soil metagenome]
MRFFARVPIRWKITLGSLAVAFVIFLVAAVLVRAEVAALLSEADAGLARNDVAAFAAELTAGAGAAADDPGTGVLLYVRNPDGEVTVDTMPHAIQETLEHRAASEEQFRLVLDDTPFVVVGAIVKASDGAWAVWSARSTASSQVATRTFDLVLGIGSLVLLAGFGLASWLLASAALRPVERMRRRAEELGADPGDGGLPLGDAEDEIRQLAVTLNALLDRVRRSAEREKQIVSDAAHELRSPLAILKTRLELAHDHFGDAGALVTDIEDAESSVERLSSLATNLLELSRLESVERRTVASTFSELEDEFMAAVDRARGLAQGKEVDVAFAIQPGHEQDSYALTMVEFGRLIDNLAANAITAVGRGGSVILQLDHSKAGLVTTVSDDGPGMPLAFIPLAFDRFSRPDDARSSNSGGSGLGLALVDTIARAAGGVVRLENGNPGLIATITIPSIPNM